MDKTNYRDRLKIAIDSGDTRMRFSTKSGKDVAIGYERIVIGARGPYIEFSENQIIRENISAPETEVWRIQSDIAFYVEYRTADVCSVKIYFQKKVVDYADYKIGFYYISPFDLKTEDLDTIITPIRQSTIFDSGKFFGIYL